MAHALLEKTLDYFLHPQNAWLYGQDVQRAMTEFSGSPDPVPEQGLDFFLDWFGFDFQFRQGQTLLHYACDSNPMQFGDGELVALREIAAHNRYDFFEVVSSGKKTSTGLTSIRDGNSYTLSRSERIRKARAGDVIVCRIAQIHGTWRLMIDQGVGMYCPGARNKRRMCKDFPVLNSQIVWQKLVRANADFFNVEATADGEMLVSGFAPGGSHQEDDDCSICQAMRKAKAEGRQLTHEELTDAFAEANKEKDKGLKN